MQPLGDFAELTRRSLGSYLSSNPPAVLIHDSATGSFQPIGYQDKKTISRQEFAFQDGSGSEAPGLPRAVAFMVLPLVSQYAPDENQLLIGRAGHCDIQIGDLSISREHARIERVRDSYVIQDLGSMVGTEVSGQIMEPGATHQLSPGEHVSLGTVVFTFLDAAAFYHFVKKFLGE